jgi:hypothetical protein
VLVAFGYQKKQQHPSGAKRQLHSSFAIQSDTPTTTIWQNRLSETCRDSRII